jgi:hypothetical protein
MSMLCRITRAWSLASCGGVRAAASRVAARCVLLVLCLLVCAAAPRVALAQDGDDESASPWGVLDDPLSFYPTKFKRSDVTALARWARFSKDQRDAALVLYDAYAERHEAAARKMWEYDEAITNGDRNAMWQDEAVRKKLEPVREEFEKFSEKLAGEFTVDVRDLLTPEQEAFGDWLDQRSDLRLSELRNGDLVGTLESVLPPEQAPDEIREAVLSYMKQANAQRREADAEEQAIIRDMAGDGDIGEALGQAQARTRVKSQEIRTAAVERIAKSLAPDQRAEFEWRTLVEGSIGSFDISALRAIRRVMKLDSLSPEQRTKLDELRLAHMKAMTELSRPMAEAQRAMMERFEARRNESDEGDDGNAEMTEYQTAAMEAMQKIASETERVTKQVRELLTPEQREAAGPPITESKIVVPDFDSDDDAPPVKLAPGMERMAQMMTRFQAGPELNEADLRVLEREAKFAPEQRDAAKDLLAAYHARFRLAARKYGDYQLAVTQQAMGGGMPSPKEIRRQVEVWLKYDRHKDRLREEALADLETLLTDEQKPAIDLVRAAARRKRGFNSEMTMTSPGASPDLPGLVRAAMGGQEPDERVASALARYEREMMPHTDEVLKLTVQNQQSMLEMLGDEDAMKRMMEWGEKSQESLAKPLNEARQVNVRFAREIAEMLPEGPRERFEDGFYRAASLGRIMDAQMSAMSGGKSLDGLVGEVDRLSDLDEGQKTRIATALADHARKAREISRAMFETMTQKYDAATSMTERQTALFSAELIGKSRERQELDNAAMKDLMAILTPEQQGRLPNPYRPAGEPSRPVFEE